MLNQEQLDFLADVLHEQLTLAVKIRDQRQIESLVDFGHAIVYKIKQSHPFVNLAPFLRRSGVTVIKQMLCDKEGECPVTLAGAN